MLWLDIKGPGCRQQNYLEHGAWAVGAGSLYLQRFFTASLPNFKNKSAGIAL